MKAFLVQHRQEAAPRHIVVSTGCAVQQQGSLWFNFGVHGLPTSTLSTIAVARHPSSLMCDRRRILTLQRPR